MPLTETEKRLKEQMEAARGSLGLTHANIATKLGIKPPSATVILTRKSGKIPQSLVDMLDVLGLELVALPKDRFADIEGKTKS